MDSQKWCFRVIAHWNATPSYMIVDEESKTVLKTIGSTSIKVWLASNLLFSLPDLFLQKWHLSSQYKCTEMIPLEKKMNNFFTFWVSNVTNDK